MAGKVRGVHSWCFEESYLGVFRVTCIVKPMYVYLLTMHKASKYIKYVIKQKIH